MSESPQGQPVRGWGLALGCLVAGVVTTLAWAPLSLFPLGLLGVGAGLWLIRYATGPVRGAWCGLAYGLGFAGALFRWTLELDVVAYLALFPVQAAFWALTGAVAAGARRVAPARWVVAVAAAWTLVEALRARVPFGGFAWGQLGTTTADLALLRPGAATVGTLGLTGLLVAVAAAGVVVISERGRRGWLPLVAAVAVLGVTIVLGSVRWTHPTGSVNVGIVQVDDPCPDDFAVDCLDLRAELLARFARGTAAIDAPVDLLLWGEGALGGLSVEDVAVGLRSVTGELPAPLAAGTATSAGRGRFRQRAVLFSAAVEPIGGYAKRQPVPFGEYVPFRGVLGEIADVGRLVPTDMVGGTSTAPLHVPVRSTSVPMGTVVSWEVTFSRLVRDVGRRAELLAVLTTVASYDRSPVSAQLLRAAQMRAVEQQKTMILAASTGRSALIGPSGERLATSALFRADELVGTVPLRSGLTPYARLGELPSMALAAGLLVWVFGRARLTRCG